MTNETRQRIESYQELLPNMKEKVAAALIMLVLALSVAVTATYAWITISRAPEVSSIATTMAANGNLEIALSKDDGLLPEQRITKDKDGKEIIVYEDFDYDEGQQGNLDINASNLQWGNLINLSDSDYYGISNLALRPAALNEDKLLTNPLKGAAYGADGRVTTLDSRYTFAKWSKIDRVFKADKTYGVRAIASYKIAETATSNEDFERRYNEVVTAFSKVSAYYKDEDGFMGTISGLGTIMSTYLQAKLNDHGVGTGSTLYLDKTGLQKIQNAYQTLFHVMELHMDALVKLANLQQYMYANQHEVVKYDLITAQDLLNNPGKYDSARSGAGNPNSPAENIMLKGLINVVTKQNSNGTTRQVDQGFIADYKQAQADLAKIEKLITESETRQIKASEIDGIVNNLSSPSDAKIDDRPVSEWMDMVKDIVGNASEFMKLKSGDHTVQLCEGILKRVEQYAVNDSARLKKSKYDSSNSARITAHAAYSIINVDIDMTGHVYTDATGLKTSSSDSSIDAASYQGGERVAEDTYGMAMDFWVRTNAEETCLTLEGALVTDSATGEILSYDGVNRIWGSTGNTNLTTDSTTQGGGSCYIYYADTADDVARSLDLLAHMKVAFVNDGGALLAEAAMATGEGQYYAQNGRITVPLVLTRSSCSYTYTNSKQEEEQALAIQELTMDNPQRITAIIYLDGEGLDNTMVLSAAEIQGQLNIQFGSSVNLRTSGDKTLETAVRRVTATLDKNNFNYATDREHMETNVTLTIDGKTPENVTAFFVRALNSTQGSREDTFKFTKKYTTGETTITEWNGEYKFTAPGTYYLRYVQLDGADYALSEPLKVEISGIDIRSVTWDHSDSEYTVYSNDSNYKQWIQVEIGAGDGIEPQKVTAVFRRTLDQISVRVATTKNVEGKWVGTAGFIGSGEYILSEIEIDGFPYQVRSEHQKTLDLYLGLKATLVHESGPLEEKYDNDVKSYTRKLYFTITDNMATKLSPPLNEKGEPVEDHPLTNAKLVYSDGTNVGKHTVDATWDTNTGVYRSELTLTKPGIYRFQHIIINNNELTRAISAPVYTLYNPEPPVYDTTSADSYAVKDEIQFVPNKLTANLGIIKITNSDTANLSAVLYNSKTGEYYTVSQTETPEANGGIVTNHGGGDWVVTLPYYTVGTGDSATKEIDGTWSLVCLKLWSCYANDKSYTVEDPLIWLGTSEVAVEYGKQNGLTPRENIDYSKLDTTVSNHVKVTMTSTKEILGDTNTPFMTKHTVGDLGISVTLTDAEGRIIPAKYSELTIATMKVKLAYDPTTAKDCGYTVSSSYQSAWDGIITLQQNSDGSWVPTAEDAARTLQYVGKYAVTLTVNGESYTHAKNQTIPEVYKVISAGPTMENLDMAKITVSQSQSIFGMSGTTVTGAFLASYQPNVTVNLPLKDAEGNPVQYVAVNDAKVTLKLHHNGDSAQYGGYTWSGDNTKLTDYTLLLRQSGTGYTTQDETGKQIALKLLAGTYRFTGTVEWNNQTADISGKLNDLTVYSAQPDVSITKLSPAAGTQVVANAYTGTDNHLSNKAEYPFTGTTAGGDHYAVVYMAYKVGDEPGVFEDKTSTVHSAEYVYYTAPTITLTAADYGAPFSFVLGKDTEAETPVTFNDNSSQTVTIGKVTDIPQKHNEQYGRDFWGPLTGDFVYKAQNAAIIGTNIIREVTTSTVDGVTYTRTLRQPLYISQLAHGEPSLTVVRGTGVASIKVENLDANTELAGGTVAGATHLRVTVTAAEGYFAPEVTVSGGTAIDWDLKQETHADPNDPNSMVTQRIYECLMPFDSMTLTASATAYPTLTYADAGKIKVTAAANGNTIASGSRVAPGTQVTVTVTTSAKDGLYAPTLSGLGEPVTKTDYSAEYTFTMGQQDTKLATPTAKAMVQLIPQNGDGFVFSFRDNSENRNFTNAGYVIPGHTVTVTMTAQGSRDPKLTAPTTGITGSTEGVTISTYTYTVPQSGPITFTGTSVGYNSVIIDTTKAKVTEYIVAGISYTVTDDGNKFTQSTAPGAEVQITLTAREGYYLPTVTQSGWEKVSGGNTNATVTYRFTMPQSGDVNVTAEAKAAPTVTLTGGNTDITIAGKNYDGSKLSGTKVQPGTVVTVTVKAKQGYFTPTVSITDGTVAQALSGRTAVEKGYDEATYTFTMGTADVTLTGAATQDPSITVKGNGVLTAGITGGTTDNGVTRAHPGKEVTVTVTAADAYYNPKLTIGSGGITFTKEWQQVTQYVTYSYTFTMGTQAVILNGTATANPTVSVTGSNISATFKDGVTSARPGSKVTVEIAPATNYYKVRVTEVTGSPQTLSKTENDKDAAANYDVTMGTNNVVLTASATQKPYITFSNISDCRTVKVAGTKVTTNSPVYVLPGVAVTIYAENTSRNIDVGLWSKYYEPPTVALSSGSATKPNRTSSNKPGNSRSYSEWKITVKAETGAITLTAKGN